MTDTNRVNLAYVKEVTYGVSPGTQLTDLRFTGESLAQENTTVSSSEIRSDRQRIGLLRTGVGAPGDMNFEFSYGAFDAWLDWALLSDVTWIAPVSIAAGPSYTITVPAGVYTITRAAGSFITDGLSATLDIGRWVEIRLMTDAGNNGYWKIASVSALVLTLTGGTGTAVAQAAPNTVATITRGGEVKNGVLLSTIAVEKFFADATATHQYQLDLGKAINTMSLEIPVDNIVTGTFGLIGKNSVSASATSGTGTNAASTQNQVMTGVDNALSILEGPTYTPQGSIQASFALANNLRPRLQLGTLGSVSLGTGTVDVTGTHRSYYTNKAIIDKANAQTQSSLAYVLEQSTGANGIVFDWPAIKYSMGKRVTPGINQDVIADMTWTAYRHATEGLTMRIARFV